MSTLNKATLELPAQTKSPQKKGPLTAAQISAIKPKPFSDTFSYMRNPKTGEILKDPATGEPLSKRPKKEWSYEGVHPVYFDDGTFEERPGRYIIKQTRQ